MREEGGIYMSKEGQLTYRVVSEFLSGKLYRNEASQLLEVRERTITRIALRIEAKGMFGVVHGNRGREPWNKGPEDQKKMVMDLVQEKYFDFNMTHCLEKLKENHGIEVKYETFRGWCHEKKLVKSAKRRKPVARYQRARMQSEGLLLQMDGSPHRYNGKDEWCLIAAIDDATSDIPYGEFFLSEDTINCMTVLQRIIERKGLPYALSHRRGYFLRCLSLAFWSHPEASVMPHPGRPFPRVRGSLPWRPHSLRHFRGDSIRRKKLKRNAPLFSIFILTRF